MTIKEIMVEKMKDENFKRKFRETMKISMNKEDVKEKLRKASLGIKFTEEHKNKIRLSNLGKKISIESRKKISESVKKNPNRYYLGKKRPELSGPNHPFWNGGSSFEGYENFTEQFKNLIRLRDNSCVICGKDNKLDVHHIDYDKLNSIKENCIALCKSCHAKTNFNRKYWPEFFYAILKDKYHYNYVIVEELKK